MDNCVVVVLLGSFRFKLFNVSNFVSFLWVFFGLGYW